jgi:hypothetical protein
METNGWQSLVGFPYDPKTIAWQAPTTSGVFRLFAFGLCVYVGESDDLQASLLDIYHGDRSCLKEMHLTHFTFETVPPETRAARRRDLIRASRPCCNLRTGGPACRLCRLGQDDDTAGLLSIDQTRRP